MLEIRESCTLAVCGNYQLKICQSRNRRYSCVEYGRTILLVKAMAEGIEEEILSSSLENLVSADLGGRNTSRSTDSFEPHWREFGPGTEFQKKQNSSQSLASVRNSVTALKRRIDVVVEPSFCLQQPQRIARSMIMSIEESAGNPSRKADRCVSRLLTGGRLRILNGPVTAADPQYTEGAKPGCDANHDSSPTSSTDHSCIHDDGAVHWPCCAGYTAECRNSHFHLPSLVLDLPCIRGLCRLETCARSKFE